MRKETERETHALSVTVNLRRKTPPLLPFHLSIFVRYASFWTSSRSVSSRPCDGKSEPAEIHFAWLFSLGLQHDDDNLPVFSHAHVTIFDPSARARASESIFIRNATSIQDNSPCNLIIVGRDEPGILSSRDRNRYENIATFDTTFVANGNGNLTTPNSRSRVTR